MEGSGTYSNTLPALPLRPVPPKPRLLQDSGTSRKGFACSKTVPFSINVPFSIK